MRPAPPLILILGWLVACGTGEVSPRPDGGAASDASGAGGSGAVDGGEPAAGGAGARDGGTPAPPSQVPAELGAAFCSLQRGCCTEMGFGVAGLAACEREQTEALQLRLGPSLQDRAVLVDESLLATCRSGFASCSEGLASVRRCATALMGTVPEGGTCRIGEECARDGGMAACFKVHPVGAPETPTGVCRRVKVAAAGEPCSTTGEEEGTFTVTSSAPRSSFDRCRPSDGLYCRLSPGGGGTCQALLPSGAACAGDTCMKGLYCDGTCQPRKPDGAACSTSLECNERCEAGVCAAGLGRKFCEG